MRYLFDIGHPKDIHTFKLLYYSLTSKGNKCIMVCRNRMHNIDLMRAYKIDFILQGKHYKSLAGKLLGLVKNEFQLIKISLNFKPDIYISHNSTTAGHVSRLFRKQHIAIEDTFNMEQMVLSVPFVDVVLTGDYPHPSLGKKEIHYPGYHELAYLHPKVFSPDVRVLEILGLKKGEKYAIIRFVAWNASHDVGHKGLSYKSKRKLISALSANLRVFISSESELPEEFCKYQLQAEPENIHSILAYAHLYVGESSTMAAESAVLGTTSLYVNDSQLGYIKDLAGYGLLYSYTESAADQESMIIKAVDLSQDDRLKAASQELRDRMLKEKIDVSAFYDWFIENYPNSERQLRKGSVDYSGFY